MKENRISEETREKIYQGCFLGLLLFASTALFLSLRKDMNEVGRILPFIPAALAGYMVIGNLLVWLHYLPEKGRVSSWFKGAAAVYWIDLIAVGFVLLSFIVSESWRHIILVNAAVVLVCWILDYRSVLKIAKELNGRTSDDKRNGFSNRIDQEGPGINPFTILLLFQNRREKACFPKVIKENEKAR